ncbi:MAG TPA: TSUP family transporter [Candidatus Limnocylindrales bacterium]|jgi:hypothetical protein
MIVGLGLLAGGAAAGLFGSLLGLGGGILIVPLLTLAFGLPLITAVGVSLVCVIMTSSAAAGVYLERRVANLRLGMTLELFTAIGALVGGLIAFLLPERVLDGLFTVLLVYTAVTMARQRSPAPAPASAVAAPDPVPATAAVADGPIGEADRDPAEDPHRPSPVPGPAPAASGAHVFGEAAGGSALGPAPRPPFLQTLSGPDYRVHRFGFGILGSIGAGLASALLGIGGGLIKVPVLHVVMGVPLRVATATSNLMIGITASASAIIYLIRGGLDPYTAAPTAIGVFVGASVGSRVAHRIDLRILRGLFVAVLLYTAWQMLQRALA